MAIPILTIGEAGPKVQCHGNRRINAGANGSDHNAGGESEARIEGCPAKGTRRKGREEEEDLLGLHEPGVDVSLQRAACTDDDAQPRHAKIEN